MGGGGGRGEKKNERWKKKKKKKFNILRKGALVRTDPFIRGREGEKKTPANRRGGHFFQKKDTFSLGIGREEGGQSSSGEKKTHSGRDRTGEG